MPGCVQAAKDTGDCRNSCHSKPAGKWNCKRKALHRSAAFEGLCHKHGLIYFAVAPPSQYINGEYAADIQFPLNIMSVKTHNISWYCAGSNWRYHVMFC